MRFQSREEEYRQADENKRGLELLRFRGTHLFNSEVLIQAVQGVPWSSEVRSMASLQASPPMNSSKGTSLDSQALWHSLVTGFGVKTNDASSSVSAKADILSFQLQKTFSRLTPGSESQGVKIYPKKMVHSQTEMNRQLWLARSVRRKQTAQSPGFFFLLSLLIRPTSKKPEWQVLGFGASQSFSSGIMRNPAIATAVNGQPSGSAAKLSAALSLWTGWHRPDGSLGSPYAGTWLPPWRQRYRGEVSLHSHPAHPERANFLPCYWSLEQSPI